MLIKNLSEYKSNSLEHTNTLMFLNNQIYKNTNLLINCKLFSDKVQSKKYLSAYYTYRCY